MEKMTVEVDLKPTAVNEFVAKAVLESTVGQAVKERIDKFLKDEHRYGSPSLLSVANQPPALSPSKVIEQYVANEWREKIQEHVAAKLTDDVVEDFVTRAWDKLKYR